MTEPDWKELKETLMGMTMKQLKPIGKRWMNGSMGGAGRKSEYVQVMVAQMRHWWLSCAEQGGRERVENVLKDIREVVNG